ncbi:MAG: TolC family protein [Bacteroidaceae bacterium]|nr:TolC family protein [Bacteroidaceae bacterium]
MKKIPVISMLALCLMPSSSPAQKQWTLDECISYALEHNIQIKQNLLSSESLQEDVLQSKASLFPSLSASTNQNVAYRPNAMSTINLTNGTMTSSSNKVSYNGSYGINANWTVWNGGRNVKNIEKSKYSSEMAELQTEQTANSIQEQIAQLYVQILYENEAVKVNEEIVKASEMQRDRAKVMVEVGSLARVDLTQLEAQVTQDQYSLVSARSQLANYKLQLKQLLEIHGGEPFDVVIPSIDDSEVLALIPSEEDVYLAALNIRPEIESGKLNIQSSQLDLAIAKAGYLPTLNLTASIGTSNASGTHTPYFRQIKNNWSNSLGLSLSIPIYDQRSARTSVNKARIAIQESQLSLQDTEKQLYSSIENYWLNATTAQQQYIYAKANVESMQQTYDLVSEQFRLGLKNIVELTTGKNNLLQAQQQLLQTKYTALLNRALLRFYQGEELKL